MSQTPTRRTLLTALGTTAVTALAGCSNNSGADNTEDTKAGTPSTATSTGSANVITNVESVAGEYDAKLRVTVAANADVDAVALRDSNGVQQQSASFGTGSAAELTVSSDMSAGTYELVTTRNGNEIDRQSIELERELTVEDVRIYASEDLPSEGFEIDATNTGDFQLDMTTSDFGVYGDVPNPEREDLLPAPDALVDNEVIGDLDPGQSATLRTQNDPLRTGNLDDEDLSEGGCTGERRTAVMEFDASEGEYTKTIEINYTLSGQPEQFSVQTGCSDWSVDGWNEIESSE